ncbi:MAG: carbohydrate-binding protein, partial [Candidatus Nanopelagicales bacterium]
MWRTLTAASLVVSLPAFGLAVTAPAQAADGLTITVVNNNPAYRSDQVFVAGTGNGSGAGSASLAQRSSFTTTGLSSGRVWVSLGKPLTTTPAPSPDTSDTRFDVVELTYPGVANLTAVDMFGIPMDIESFDSSGHLVGSKKWGCYTDKIQQAMQAKLGASGGKYSNTVRTDPNGNFLRLVSPNIVSGAHPSGYPRFDAYVKGLRGQQLTIRGHAMGQDYRYTGSFAADPSDPSGPGSLTLTDQSASHLQQMYVKGSSLVGNAGNETAGIYGNNSPYYIGGQLHSGNDVYGAVYRDLVAGFAYGFWGSPSYGNDSGRFNVSAAPGPFEAAQPNAVNYNPWAAALWPLTDAYGFPYGDTYNDDAARNPIVQLPTNGTLKITIDPDVSPTGCGSPPTPTPTPTPTRTSTPTPTPTLTPTPTPTRTSTPTPTPTPPSGVRSAFGRVEAELPSVNSGGVIESGHVAGLGNGDWLEYGSVDFGSGGLNQIQSLVSGGSSGSGLVSYRVDSPTGPLLGNFAVGNTGGWNSYRQIPANASGPTGVHKLYVAFTSGYPGDYVNLDRFQLQKAGQARPDLVNVT